jgi:hypothetical protein
MWPFLSRHKWIIAYLIIIVAIIASLFITGWGHSLPPSWGIVAIVIAIVGFVITYLSTLERNKENTDRERESDTKPEEVVFAPSPKIEVIHRIEPAEEPDLLRFQPHQHPTLLIPTQCRKISLDGKQNEKI